MRTDQARPVRLQDYRPSDWLIDKVDLDIALHPSATRVRARLSVRPNPTASGAEPLRLDGDELSSVVGRHRRRRAAARRLCGDARQPDDRAAAARRVPARDRNHARPLGQHQVDGALSFQRHLLHAMRGRRFPPHHVFSRPPRRDGGLHHAHRSRPRRCSGAARQRQSCRNRQICRAKSISRSGTTRIRSRLICSLWSAAISAVSTTASRTMSGRYVALQNLCRARQGRPLRLCHGFAQAFHALGRGRRSGANTTSTFS